MSHPAKELTKQPTEEELDETAKELLAIMNRISDLKAWREAIDKELKKLGVDPESGTIQSSDQDIPF